MRIKHPSTAVMLLSLVTPDATSQSLSQSDQAWSRRQSMEQQSLFQGLPWRCIGPVDQGGRLVDIEPVPGEPFTFYIAYASGGIWKTENSGTTYEPLFDFQRTIIIGDLAVDPQDPQTLWVGTGENNSSRSSYGGAGVFRSKDGGKTWQPAGLAQSDRIGRILVDPRNSKRVVVASLGPLYTEGGQRGIYETTDGGASWTPVLTIDERTGFVDMVRDPTNPDILYASAWERLRRPWDFVESGPGSAIYKSMDGGTSWSRLSGGFPEGEHVGRIGLTVCAANPKVVYALLDNQEPLPESEWDLGSAAVTPKRLRKMTKEEFLAQDLEEVEDFVRSQDLDPALDAKTLRQKIQDDEITLDALLDACADGNAALFDAEIRGCELWRSDDGGATWARTHQEPLREIYYTYGYYFGQVRVSPSDPDRVYLLGVPLVTSADGGKTFSGLNARNVHVDHQSFWIDPEHPQRILDGNDGGLNLSMDGGENWLKLNTNPVGQIYNVTVDMADPYHVYVGLQDNGVLKGSSRWQLGNRPWTRVGGGDGMYIQVDPRDDATTYYGYQFGWYFRRDASGKVQRITPRNSLQDPALRYNWNTPILLSPHSPETLYFGSNQLFRSLDKGETWTAISEDLTVSEDRGNVPFATITSLAESPLQFGLLWAGTDDGQLHVTSDGGQNWRRFDDFPRRWVSRIETSPHQRDTAYLSFNGYRDDDPEALLFVTEDLGENWRSIAEGLPDEPINVIREDPVTPGVLYVGTDRGAYVSFDQGENWSVLNGGLPHVSVHDLVVHPRERELVAGTHGRSVWILDALPLQEFPEIQEEGVHVFPLESMTWRRRFKQRRSRWFHDPKLEPDLEIPFYVKQAGSVEFAVLDGNDRVLRQDTFEARRGMNQYVWDLLFDEALALAAEESEQAEAADQEAEDQNNEGSSETAESEGASDETGLVEPQPLTRAQALALGRRLYVEPGKYKIRFSMGEQTHSTEFEVKPPEPRQPRAKPPAKIRGRK